MRSLSLITGLILLSWAAAAQSAKLVWASQMKGNSFDVCQAITTDSDGNIYATGYFSSINDFDPGPGVFNLQSVNAEDIFLAKYRPDGSLVWAKSIGDFRYQAGYAIALDSLGNIYITGIFFGSLDFDPGPGVTTLSSAGNEDVFIARFTNDGNLTWAKKIGGPSNDFCNAILLDRAGNIYMNGYFDGTSDFDPGTGIFNMTSAGSTDIYICKLNAAGNFLWARQVGGTLSEGAYALGLDAQNNVYSTGFFWNTVDFDPGPGVYNMVSNGFGDGFLLKLNSGGSFLGAGKIGGDGAVRCTALRMAGNNSLYITGYFDGDTDFDPGTGTNILSSPRGNEDVFVAKYDLSLNLLWAKPIGGPSFQRSFGVDTDAASNVYVTGHYNGSADFDPGPGDRTLTASNDPDIFVLKLDPNGEYEWVAQGTGRFYGSGYAIRLDRQNNILVAGTFEGTKDFDPGPDEWNLSSAGQSEIFIQKLRQCANAPLTRDLTVQACTAYTLNGKTYDSSGNYVNILLNDSGCDSILTNLHLTITRAAFNRTVSICEGQTFLAGGKPQTKAGIYYDTLKTAAGCDSLIITTLLVNPAPKPTLGADRNLCAGQELLLNPGSFSSYLWQDNSSLPVYKVTGTGTYRVTVTNASGCTGTARLIIRNIVQPPAGFLPADQPLCTGNVLKISVPGFRSYTWNTGSTMQGIEIRDPGLYVLRVVDIDQCIGIDSIRVTETNCIPVGIPNAFTPNGDGKNDLFRPVLNREITEYLLQVFSRGGQLLFHSREAGKGWDGRFRNQSLDAGTFVYILRFRDTAGKLYTYKGNISLLR